MKKFMILGMLLFAFFSISEFASAQGCTPVCQGSYTPAGNPFTLELDDYPGCEVKIYYEYLECELNTYFRLVAISFEDIPDCIALRGYLLPMGWGSNADAVALTDVWYEAFSEIAKDWFKNVYSSKCRNFHTITPGGCYSWTYARQPPDETRMYSLYRFVYVPCNENGCCVTTQELCWNENYTEINVIETATTYSGVLDCQLTSPLYDPFEDWDEDWIRSGYYTPCFEECIIEQ